MSTEKPDQELTDLRTEIVELQTRLQFQDDTLFKLDDALIRQARLIDQLQQRLRALEDKLEQLEFERSVGTAPPAEKPPHY